MDVIDVHESDEDDKNRLLPLTACCDVRMLTRRPHRVPHTHVWSWTVDQSTRDAAEAFCETHTLDYCSVLT